MGMLNVTSTVQPVVTVTLVTTGVLVSMTFTVRTTCVATLPSVSVTL